METANTMPFSRILILFLSDQKFTLYRMSKISVLIDRIVLWWLNRFSAWIAAAETLTA